MSFLVQDGQTVVFIGDSITDCGRRDVAALLGNGYVKFIADLIAIRNLAFKFTLVNKGISGNTVANLWERWHDDILALKPDWFSILTDINDVHFTLHNKLTPVLHDHCGQKIREEGGMSHVSFSRNAHNFLRAHSGFVGSRG